MRWVLLSADAVLVLASILLAVNLRFEGEIPAKYQGANMMWTHIAIVCVNLGVYKWYGLYGKVWRYAGIHELKAIFNAVSVSYLPFVLLTLASSGALYPRSIIVIAWIFTLMLVGALRFMFRLTSERQGGGMANARRMLIVGANDAGEAILRELARQPTYSHIPVGFIDDSKERAGLRIRDVPVLGTLEDLPTIAREREVNEIVVADPRPPLVRRVVSLAEPLPDVELKMVPSVADVVDGRTTASLIRDVRLEDLLVRPPVKIDLTSAGPFLKGKRVLVTGAGGSIGSEICRQTATLGIERLMLLGRGENSIHEITIELNNRAKIPMESVIADVRDRRRLARVFERFHPAVVFHAAAHKHVPMMEQNPEEAITVNALGTRNLVDLSAEYGVECFILLSTDKAVNPVSVMGWSKRLAEMAVLDAARRATLAGRSTRFVAVRFGNVLGSRGSVVPTFRRQIAMGGPVTVTDPEMTRFFMTIPEAVTLVIEAAAMARGGEIYILDMGEAVKILDLARNMIRLSGFEPETDIPIQVLGLRPGEKLTEELLNEGERASPTEADKIQRVESVSFDADAFNALLTEIETCVSRGEEDRIVSRLRALRSSPADKQA